MPGSTLKRIISKEQRVTCHVLLEVPMLEKLLNNMKMLVQLFLLHNFLHNHMRYIYRQIYNLKGKKFCLNKISFFVSFLQTVVQSSLSPHAADTSSLLGMDQKKPFQADPARFASFHAVRSAWSKHSCGVPHRADTLVFCSWIFFFIHLHHLRLPLHQIGMYKAGSVGSGQAIFLPFA